MSTRCLICDSSAVVSADAVKAVVLLISTLHGFLRAARQLQPVGASPGDAASMENAFTLLANGVKASEQKWAENQSFLKDVHRFQFRQYGCLCLRCGALFDESAEV
jgi:hypothetical protein